MTQECITGLSPDFGGWVHAYPLHRTLNIVEALMGGRVQLKDLAIGVYAWEVGAPNIKGCDVQGRACANDGLGTHAIAAVKPLLVTEYVGVRATDGRVATGGFAPTDLRHMQAHTVTRTGCNMDSAVAQGLIRPGDVCALGAILFRRHVAGGSQFSFIVSVAGARDRAGNPVTLWDAQIANLIAEAIFTDLAREPGSGVEAAVPQSATYMVTD